MKDTRESRRVSGGQRRGEGRPQGKGQGAQCPKKSGVGESRVRRWSVACRRVVACGCGSAHRGGAVGWLGGLSKTSLCEKSCARKKLGGRPGSRSPGCCGRDLLFEPTATGVSEVRACERWHAVTCGASTSRNVVCCMIDCM